MLCGRLPFAVPPSAVRPPPRPAPVRERGASVVEYASVIVLAATLLACLVVFLPSISDGVGSALCRLLNLAGVECEDEPEKKPDLTPAYCPKTVDKHTAGFRADIGFVHIGQEYSFSKSKLADGRIVATSVPSMDGGASAGAGFDFGDNRGASASGKGEASVSARLAAGTTFIFKDAAEYEKFEEELHTYVSRENQKTLDPNSGMGVALADTIDPPEIPEPDIRTSTVEVEGNVNYGIGAWSTDPKKKSKKNGDLGDEDDGGMNLNLGAQGDVTVNKKMDISDWKNGDRSETYGWHAEGELGTNVLTKTNADAARWSGSTRVMRDKNNKITNIRYATITSTSDSEGTEGNAGKGNSNSNNSNENGGKGSSKGTDTERSTQMVQLDFDTPGEQEMAERMLEERGTLPPANILDYSRGDDGNPIDTANTDSNSPMPEPAPDAPDWEQHAHEQGRVWQFDSDDRVDENGFDASLKMGLQFGVGANWATEERRTKDASYLGPPNADGTREFVDYEPCVAKPAD